MQWFDADLNFAKGKTMRVPKQSESVSRRQSNSRVDEGGRIAYSAIEPFPAGGWSCEHTGGNPPAVADGGVMCINHEQYMCWNGDLIYYEGSGPC